MNVISNTLPSLVPLWVHKICFISAGILTSIAAYKVVKHAVKRAVMTQDPYVEIVYELNYLKCNPYFVKVWEELNQQRKIRFEVIPKEVAELKENYRVGKGYSSDEHKITLVEWEDLSRDLVWEELSSDFPRALIFECCSALQPREQAIETYSTIVNYGIDNLRWDAELLDLSIIEPKVQ